MNRVPSKTAPPSLSFDNEDDEDENHHSVLLKVGRLILFLSYRESFKKYNYYFFFKYRNSKSVTRTTSPRTILNQKEQVN